MKKSLLILVSFLFAQSFFAQIVFCPSGAKWNFLNKSGADAYPFEKNESVVYSHDTLVDGKPAKVLKHSLFYSSNSETCPITLIKQIGDTVFLRNQFTQHTWQILYNFNATPGQTWQNALLMKTFTATAVYNFTTSVDSVKIFNANGTNFKRLYVRTSNSANASDVDFFIITERFGSNRFLFYWDIFYPFQINYFTQILCYEDENWPLQLFSSKPCNYSNVLGLKQSVFESEQFMVYPNPVLNDLTIQWENSALSETLEIGIYNDVGERLKQSVIKNGGPILLGDFSPGLYFIQLFTNSKRVYSTKIIKE